MTSDIISGIPNAKQEVFLIDTKSQLAFLAKDQ